MTMIDKNNFEAALRAKRDELIRTMRGSAAELTLETSEPELIDHVQGMNGRDEIAIMLNKFSSTFEDVERSLRAISEGSYGVCATCEEPIASKRLAAIPWAANCISCQQQFEAAQKKYDEAYLWRVASRMPGFVRPSNLGN
jgi:DnaK suppressor protein